MYTDIKLETILCQMKEQQLFSSPYERAKVFIMFIKYRMRVFFPIYFMR
jgi:hypothetical protein